MFASKDDVSNIFDSPNPRMGLSPMLNPQGPIVGVIVPVNTKELSIVSLTRKDVLLSCDFLFLKSAQFLPPVSVVKF